MKKTTIKALRISIGKSQKDIAKILNCTQGTISKIEKGEVFGIYYKKYLSYLSRNDIDINKLFRN